MKLGGRKGLGRAEVRNVESWAQRGDTRDFQESRAVKTNKSRTGVFHVCKLIFSLGRWVFVTDLSFTILKANLRQEIGHLSNKDMRPLFYTFSVHYLDTSPCLCKVCISWTLVFLSFFLPENVNMHTASIELNNRLWAGWALYMGCIIESKRKLFALLEVRRSETYPLSTGQTSFLK